MVRHGWFGIEVDGRRGRELAPRENVGGVPGKEGWNCCCGMQLEAGWRRAEWRSEWWTDNGMGVNKRLVGWKRGCGGGGRWGGEVVVVSLTST